MKRVLSLLLSVLLLFSGCLPMNVVARAYLRAGGGTIARHGQTPFADMVLSYPDPDAVLAALDKAIGGLDRAGEQESIVAYEEQLSAYNQLVSAASLAYVRYCQDVTDQARSAEYGRLNSALYPLQHRLAQLEKELMDSWGYHKERGLAYAQALDRITSQDGAAMDVLREREDELCRQYEGLDGTYRLTYGGKTWSMADLMTDDTLTLQQFLEALELYQRGKNQAAGEIFLELMAVRKGMARSGAHSSYVASQYQAFGRAYTPEEALEAAQTVKRVFVPLYIRLRERCENDLRYLSGASFREDEFLAAMEGAVEQAMRGAGEAWRYMLALGLYDSKPSEKKMRGSFTTYLAAYRCPFLFTQWTDDASSAFTVIHEFGHFLSYYLNPEGTYYAEEDLDLAETDAQGFELLMLSEYDAIFGRYAAAAQLCFFTNALYAILSGFMEDEFQQHAYALQDPSVEDLNRLYGQLAKEYGFDRLFGYEGMEWTEISHTFQFPFYYVSYGVSMLGAMALVQGGSRAYGRVVKRQAGTPFMEAIGQDVLTEEAVLSLAAWVETLADGLLDA